MARIGVVLPETVGGLEARRILELSCVRKSALATLAVR